MTKSENFIRTCWGYNLFLSGAATTKKGVAILFNNNFEYKLYKVVRDPDGCFIIMDIEFVGKRFTMVDVYGTSSGDNPDFFFIRLVIILIHNIQKKLYVGRIRPVLEYGISSWGTAAKANFDKVERVQNQASRIITGAMKSTPIKAMDTLTGLEGMDSRRDIKILTQSAKFKRLKDHPMKKRMSEPSKCR